MRVEELRSFCAVVDAASFTRAAGELFLTQAAVSRHIASLERSLGMQLLNRTGRGIDLTEAGQVVYNLAVELLDQAAAIHNAVQTFKELEGGNVAVAAGVVAGNYILPAVTAQFRVRFPHVRIALRARPAPIVFEEVAQAKADFGLILGPDVPSGLLAKPAFQDALLAIVSPDHSLASYGAPIPAAALAGASLVTLAGRRRQSRRLLESWLQGVHVALGSGVEMETYEQIKQVVAAGFGVAFLFRSMVTTELRAGILCALEIVESLPQGPFVFVFRPEQRLSPATRALIRFIADTLARQRMLAVCSSTGL